MSEHDDALQVAYDHLAASQEDVNDLFAAALRVWSNNREREDWKEFDALGDQLYHLSDGAFGRCGKYDTDECLTEDEQRARWGATWAEIQAGQTGYITSDDGDLGEHPPPVLGRLTKPFVPPWLDERRWEQIP